MELNLVLEEGVLERLLGTNFRKDPTVRLRERNVREKEEEDQTEEQ